ncbi:MAG: PIN domain-containing protein [Burkholderiales bacterium]
MIAADTSVVVAAFASWHEGHAAALRALGRGVRVPAHVLLESYSVLTRLPPPHRAAARHWTAPLLTRDRRAAATYEKVGARYEWVA